MTTCGDTSHATWFSVLSVCVPHPIWLCAYGTWNILDSLLWRHNGRDSILNHQLHDCLLNRLFSRRSKKTSKLRVTGLCAGNSPAPVNSPHKWPVTRKMFPFDDVIMFMPHLIPVLGAPNPFTDHPIQYREGHLNGKHYSDVIMGAMTSQITSLTIVNSTVYSGANRKKNIKVPRRWLLWGWPENSPQKEPVTLKIFHLMTPS